MGAASLPFPGSLATMRTFGIANYRRELTKVGNQSNFWNTLVRPPPSYPLPAFPALRPFPLIAFTVALISENGNSKAPLV